MDSGGGGGMSVPSVSEKDIGSKAGSNGELLVSMNMGMGPEILLFMVGGMVYVAACCRCGGRMFASEVMSPYDERAMQVQEGRYAASVLGALVPPYSAGN